MDGYTGKSRGLPPFAGGDQIVSLRDETYGNKMPDQKSCPVHRPSKNIPVEFIKGCSGAMDGYTGKSRGLPPFAGGGQSVSLRDIWE